MEINNIINLYDYFKEIKLTPLNFSMTENTIIFNKINNEKLKNIIEIISKLTLEIKKIAYYNNYLYIEINI